jgi:hypothetical protein
VDTGSSNLYTDCTATDCADGFWIQSSSNLFTRCSARGFGHNGFRVYFYGSNSFQGCSALGFPGQGFNNGGVNTNLGNCTFLGNRIDLANQVGAGANFAGSLETDRFVTGDATTEPEL